MTVKVRPAIVNVPLRAGPVLRAALNPTPPGPLPLAPAVIVSHGALLAAVQRQLFVVATLMLPVPPPLGMFWLVGVMPKVQALIVKLPPMINPQFGFSMKMGPLVAPLVTEVMICVSLTTVNAPSPELAKRTEVTPRKLVPVKVTCVP